MNKLNPALIGWIFLTGTSAVAQTTHTYQYDPRGRLSQACRARALDAQLSDYKLDRAENRSQFENKKVDIWLPADSGIFSANGQSVLWMQSDGNLVVYKITSGGWVYGGWHAATNGSGATAAYFQNDGNLVLYAGQGVAVWSTGTNGNDCAQIAVQDDGDVVIKSIDGRVLWHTNTGAP
jgi:hypothetical protein